jgi:hypothetical protein
LLNTVSWAVDRSLGCVEEVLGLEDAREAVKLHTELSTRRQELWSAMNEPTYVYWQEDDDRMAQADTALRKLNIKKREIMNINRGGSPFPLAAYQPPPPLVRQNAFQFPSGDGGGSQQQSQGLSNDSVAKRLSVLAKGQSKLATPSWPKVANNYCSYYVFKEELEAYVRDYAHGVSDRTLAQKIKQHSLSKGIADNVEFATLVAEILAILSGLFARPSKLIDSLIDPVKKAKKKVQCDDWPKLLAYLSKVRNMFQEVKRLNEFNLFSNVNNVDAVLEKLPTAEVEQWLEHSSGLNDNQLATALEKFVTERWTYTTTLVSLTTSADQALKSMGIAGSGGGGSQQGRARPGSPKNNKKKPWWEAKKKADVNGTIQVPLAAAQPSGGGGGQNAQLSQIAAAGAYIQRGPGAEGHNVQASQNNQNGGRQIAVQAQQVG